jgi:hypothetical protein
MNKVPEKMPGEGVLSKRVTEGACLQGQEDTPGTAAAVAAGRLDKARETVPGAAEKAAEEHSLDQNTVETWLQQTTRGSREKDEMTKVGGGTDQTMTS